MARPEAEFKSARDSIVESVLHAHTQSGWVHDREDAEEAKRDALDAVANAYQDGLTDEQWRDAAMALLPKKGRPYLIVDDITAPTMREIGRGFFIG